VVVVAQRSESLGCLTVAASRGQQQQQQSGPQPPCHPSRTNLAQVARSVWRGSALLRTCP
jgi:hypothetical protein